MTGKRVIVVGGTGKIGRHLVRRLVELGNEVHSLARFSDPTHATREEQEALGVKTFARDVAQADAFAGVPRDYDYVFYEVGLKFGSEADPEYTVEVNVRAAGRAMEHFAGVRGFLMASTGNVYADTVDGAAESDMPLPPSFYAITRLAGEWMVDYFSRRNNTPAVIQRIFYAYHEAFGVPTDIARQIRDGEPIDLSTPYVNVIWLDDLLELMIASAKLCAVPPRIINLTGTENVSVRWLAERLGELMGKEPKFVGEPGEKSLLGKTEEMVRLLGAPNTSLEEGLQRIARSVMAREYPLDHPTKWEKRAGF